MPEQIFMDQFHVTITVPSRFNVRKAGPRGG